jgi:hypothetical protein
MRLKIVKRNLQQVMGHGYCHESTTDTTWQCHSELPWHHVLSSAP